MSNITWLASYPKSGNTWVRAFLGSLLQTDGEFNMKSMESVSAQCVSKGLYKDVFGDVINYADVPEALLDRPRIQVALDRFLGEQAGTKLARRFIKTHSIAAEYRGAPMIVPGLAQKSLLIVRNPFDVCLSACNHFGFDIERSIEFMQNPKATMGGVEANLPRYPLYLSTWRNHTLSWLRRKDMKIRLVRYEDLHHFPLREFRAIATDIAGISDEARILKALADSDFDALKERERTEGFVEKSPRSERFFMKGTIGDGFAALSPEQRNRLYEPVRFLCEALGYQYDGNRFAIGRIDSQKMRQIIDATVVRSVGKATEPAAKAS